MRNPNPNTDFPIAPPVTTIGWLKSFKGTPSCFHCDELICAEPLPSRLLLGTCRPFLCHYTWSEGSEWPGHELAGLVFLELGLSGDDPVLGRQPVTLDTGHNTTADPQGILNPSENGPARLPPSICANQQ